MRTQLLGLLGVGFAFLTGCSSSDSNNVSVAEAKSSLVRDAAPTVSTDDQTTLANDNQAFALNAYGALAKGASNGNVFFSPYSVSSALAMTYAGANGQTATEMASALHFSLPQAQLHPAFDRVDLALTTPPAAGADGTTPFTLHVANSLWGQKDFAFQPSFLDTLAVDYGAGVYLEDFKTDPGGAEKTINAWVADKTDDKIENLLHGNVTQDTRMVLVNAIYFDADWKSQFKADDTSNDTFTTASGGVSVPMMHAPEFAAPIAQTSTYDAIEIPYNGAAVMDIVMPKAGTFAAFEPTLTSTSLATIIGGMTTTSVSLTLPKFSYEGDTVSLKSLLQGLGMNVAFTRDADFTGIASQGQLFIGDVLQKAYLKVDEKGTEAAAATAVVAIGAAFEEPQPTAFKVDHPFFFTIRDTATNTILFAGRILDPSK